MKLIALAGPAGSGKDSVAYRLARRGWEPVAFAEPLRQMLEPLLEHLGHEARWHDRAWKEAPLAGLGRSPRQLLQTLGTEWGRRLVAQDLWLQIARRGALGLMRAGQPVVFTDCRFPNEAALVRGMGGLLWHLRRPDRRAIPGAGHESESPLGILAGDLVIHNTGTLAELHAMVDHLLDLARAGQPSPSYIVPEAVG